MGAVQAFIYIAITGLSLLLAYVLYCVVRGNLNRSKEVNKK